MLDVGWGELLLIGVVALIVVGPKDLPRLFKTAGHFMGRARGMAREFQRSMEQAADDSGFKDASDSLKAVNRLNLNSPTTAARKYAAGLAKSGDGAAPAPTILPPAPANRPEAASPAAQPDAAPPPPKDTAAP